MVEVVVDAPDELDVGGDDDVVGVVGVVVEVVVVDDFGPCPGLPVIAMGADVVAVTGSPGVPPDAVLDDGGPPALGETGGGTSAGGEAAT